jgi:AraC-like DNA-binding protein
VDVLSQAIVVMRSGAPRSFEVECHAPWGRRYPAVAGAGFHVILQGSAWLIPRDGEPRTLGLGDVVLLPHGTPHGMADRPDTPLREMDHDEPAEPVGSYRVTIGPDGPGTSAPPTAMLCGSYVLDRSRTHPLVADLPEVVHIPARLGRHPELRAAVDLLAAELQAVRTGSGVAVTALLDLMLVQILRAWYDERPDSGWGAALADPAVSTALRLIHTHPERPWTVAGLAAEVGLSRAAFARRFRELVAWAPLNYLTWWRMVLAARMLRDSHAPLATIARRVGYTSEFAFANAFKREHGIAPGRYRADHRSAPPAVAAAAT